MSLSLSPIGGRFLLVVEGPEDRRFWNQYLPSAGKASIDVRETGGKNELRRFLRVLALASGFQDLEWIGIIQDADSDPRAAFDRIRGALGAAGLPVPAHPWSTTSSTPRVIAFVVPDENSPGDFESLLWRGLSGQTEATCIDDYLRCLQGVRGTTLERVSKARVYSYIASLPNPDSRLSHAILQRHVQSADFQRLIDFLP